MLLHPYLVAYCLKASCVPKLCHVTSHLWICHHSIIRTLVVALELAYEAVFIFIQKYTTNQKSGSYIVPGVQY